MTVSEYLAQHAAGGTLARLATGSWIRGDLTTWIGDPEHNRAWEALARTRAHLVRRAARPGTQGVAGGMGSAVRRRRQRLVLVVFAPQPLGPGCLFDRLFRHDLARYTGRWETSRPGGSSSRSIRRCQLPVGAVRPATPGPR